ncbi:TlpA disulfide reductase family protein [Nocardioides sp.]|uniref:TlpA family protein disulfide reductase n=1 Tax=Nocardioides sp. TaxID=35761 RepID=UPI002735F026|nr:TlpA disulfide reductase family protein [Nocardioides sp.]MDP3892718.1 TlpA disulfide reductase family protein [Nocardioides sp.]
MSIGAVAPEFDVSEWIGQPQPLEDLRGRVVLVETFQMLCPGCVSHGLPQATRVQAAFPDVAVVGLHTVFEHHDAMTPLALRAFLSEYRITFPVGIDRHDADPIPTTMQSYGLQGTPSTLLIDRLGRLRLSAFGALDDLQLGVHLGRLLDEPSEPPVTSESQSTGALSLPGEADEVAAGSVCQPTGCS